MLVKKNMDAGEYYDVLADMQKKNKERPEKNGHRTSSSSAS